MRCRVESEFEGGPVPASAGRRGDPHGRPPPARESSGSRATAASRPDRNHDQVERPELCPDSGERGSVAGVAAEEGAMCRADHGPRRPLRGVAGEAAPGEVPGSVQTRVGPPIVVDPSRSSSMMRRSGTSQLRRCAPIPSGTTNGAVEWASRARTVADRGGRRCTKDPPPDPSRATTPGHACPRRLPRTSRGNDEFGRRTGSTRA
jgi:hypothetical protein